MKTGKVLLGVLAGVATGAILGLLFAPEKGSVTRKKICRKTEDASDELKDKFDELVNSLTEKFEAAKEEVSDLYEKGKRKAEDIKNDVKAELS